MAGICDDLQELVIPGHATHILRRAGVLPDNAQRITVRLAHRQALLQGDAMQPGIAEIVEVVELPAVTQNREQFLPRLVDQLRAEVPFGVGDAVAQAADVELMEMVISPPHGRLDHGMQLHQSDGVRHQHTAPEHGVRVAQFDAQLQQSLRIESGHHFRATARRSD
jgi:hypothetical protein